jgi:hypothetical protein
MTRPSRQPARSALSSLSVARPTTFLLALLLLALVVTAGCGVTSDETPQPLSADAAHEVWIAALREGNQDGALVLTDPDLPERATFAREAVSRMQEYLTSPASPTGALQHVAVEPVSDGVGRSVWQFANKRWCYRAELVSREGSWFVSRWGQTSVECS